MEYGTCEFCQRTDVPICPSCHELAPHGMTPGTYLPCHCGGMGDDNWKTILHNVSLVYQSLKSKKEGGENNES